MFVTYKRIKWEDERYIADIAVEIGNDELNKARQLKCQL